MLRLFRNPTPFTTVFIFLFTIGIKFWAFLHPQLPLIYEHTIVWNEIVNGLNTIFNNSAIAFTVFATVNIFAQALFINRIAEKNLLFHHSSLLPAVCYILLSASFKELNYFNQGLVANWCILLAINTLLSLDEDANKRKLLFNIGLFISLAALIDYSYIIILPAFFISLAILRYTKITGYILMLFGIITPIYFLVTLLFLFDKLHLINSFLFIKWSYPFVFKNLSIVLVVLSILIIWGILSMFYLSKYYKKMLANIKNEWIIIILLALFGALSTIITLSNGIIGWMLFWIFTSFIFANPFYENKKKWISNILFYLIVITILWAQWLPNTINFIH